jgi:hypothetical protein
MDEDQPLLRLRRPPPAKVGEDLYRITEDLDFIKAQLAQVPTIKQLCRCCRRSRPNASPHSLFSDIQPKPKRSEGGLALSGRQWLWIWHLGQIQLPSLMERRIPIGRPARCQPIFFDERSVAVSCRAFIRHLLPALDLRTCISDRRQKSRREMWFIVLELYRDYPGTCKFQNLSN